MQEKNDNKDEEKIVVVKAILTKDCVMIPSSEDIEGLSSRGYGTKKDSELMLSFYESLYLMNKGIIEVRNKKKKSSITFNQVLDKYRAIDENAWVRYLIYRDLRSRGYVVREGFGLGIDFRVYQRGEFGRETADYLVLGILEGKPLLISDLAQILKYSQSLKKNLVLAVLNRKGEIVYYSFSQLNLQLISAQNNAN